MTENTPLGPMTENAPDPTTKSAGVLANLALLLAVVGAGCFIVGFFLLATREGEAWINTPLFFGGGFCLTTGLLMMTIQSAAMLIIREMWAIEHQRDKP
jgi:hypothetical protein